MCWRSRRGGARRLLAAGSTITLLLGGCATLPPPAAPIPWAQNLAQLRAISEFDLQGRLAAATGTEGFSAGLRWRQRDQAATIDLSAPLGFGAAHIEQSANTLQITTSKGVVLAGDAASDELQATLGFEPPLASLRYWMLGASDPASEAQESLDPQQRLIRLQQGGWQVDYGGYVQVQRHWLPRRLTVTRGALRLRVAVDEWQLP